MLADVMCDTPARDPEDESMSFLMKHANDALQGGPVPRTIEEPLNEPPENSITPIKPPQ